MNVNQLKTSNFLKRDDVGDGVVVTIRSVSQQNVAKEGAPEELKWVLHVDEFDKGMVLNSTNGQLIAHALKSEESDDWVGQQVILFDDPSVSFGGKLVGGIRVRPVPKASAAPAKRTTSPARSVSAASKINQLKAKFKAHPEFGKQLQADDINGQCLQRWGVKLDGLSDEQADEALEQFDDIVQACLDEMPF